jgi:hypothetical protein
MNDIQFRLKAGDTSKCYVSRNIYGRKQTIDRKTQGNYDKYDERRNGRCLAYSMPVAPSSYSSKLKIAVFNFDLAV